MSNPHPPRDHVVTIQLDGQNIRVDQEELPCRPQDTITWTATADIGRWVVGFPNGFPGSTSFFTGEGTGTSKTNLSNRPGDYHYFVFGEIEDAAEGTAQFLDPKIVLQDSSGGSGLPRALRAYAVDLGELSMEMSEAMAKAAELQERSIALAREIEDAGWGATDQGNQGDSPVEG